MGIVRKTFSGTAAAMTAGLSLIAFPFRNDTERTTREVKKTRRSLNRQGRLMAHSEKYSADDAMRLNQPNAPQKALNGDETSAKVVSSSSLSEQLAQLHLLHQVGALSDDEFATAKTAILNPTRN